MKMKYLLLLSIIFLTSGCWNYTELNDLAIVKGVSVDFENNKYVVNYMISNASSKKSDSNGTSPQTALIEGKGKSVVDAISEIKLIVPKKIYIGHMLVYVISEEVAKKGIAEASDYFFRNSSSKRAFQIVIAKDVKAKDTLKILSPLDSFPSDNITNNLATTESFSANVSNTSFITFIRKIKDDGIEATANGITVIGSAEKGSSEDALKKSSVDNYIKVEPMAIFKKDKLIAWSDEDISNGINILLNTVRELELQIPYKTGYLSFLITDLKIKKDFIIKEHVTYNIDVKTNSEIEEMTTFIDIEKETGVEVLEKLIEKELERILNKTIEFVKKNKTDSLGLGYQIYIKNYKAWEKLKDKWDEEISQIQVNFKIKTTLLADKNTNEGTDELIDE